MPGCTVEDWFVGAVARAKGKFRGLDQKGIDVINAMTERLIGRLAGNEDSSISSCGHAESERGYQSDLSAVASRWSAFGVRRCIRFLRASRAKRARRRGVSVAMGIGGKQ